MKYKFLTHILVSLFFAGFAMSCNDELISGDSFFEEKELSEVKLHVDVSEMSTYSRTRAEESLTEEEMKGSEEERKIEDIWLFQFNANGDALLCEPRYYPVADSHDISVKGVDVLLALDIESKIYVVANVHDRSWATVANSKTLADVKTRTLPINNTELFKVIPGNKLSASIPMEGEINAKLSYSEGEAATVKVPVTRMFAKLEITLNDVPETLKITDLEVQNIPSICRVGTLWDTTGEGSTRAEYPEGTDWTSNAFNAGDKDENDKYPDKYVIYIPENLQGQKENGQADYKTADRPVNSILINFHAIPIDPFTKKEYGTQRIYSFCPGANIDNDYNIRRNYIYKVRLHLYTDKYEQETPSSNCFVVRPGQKLSFLPYYRIEKGGGYNFEDYLDPSGEDENKMIDRVFIIWQTPDAIGDNSKGDLVTIDPSPDPNDPDHAKKERARKIYVQAGSKIGNALIAGYNKNGDIVWSWHIWVADHDPANVSSAAVYTTYGWDEKGIYTNARVPGYAIMRCNLGAFRNEPDPSNPRGITKFDTYGLLYQWGRKDPFPPMKKNPKGGSYYKYDNVQANIHVTDNSNKEIVMTGDGTPSANGELFNTILTTNVGTKKEEGLLYSIQHPTMFIAGAKPFGNYNDQNLYINRGDWLPEGDEKLWGAIERNENMKRYVYDRGRGWSIWDNYGTEKTIFDPCPSGWRVPPGDLWLGFTKTGLNVSGLTQINMVEWNNESLAYNQHGFTIFLQDWRGDGDKSFFPTQGSRLASGQPILGGVCGNYHNATTGITVNHGTVPIDRVNILHLHNDGYKKLNIFEDQLLYYNKSVGGPIRCVRDHK